MSGALTRSALRGLDALNRWTDSKEDEAAHLTTGRRGEEQAYFYLRRQGYVMVARNWRSPRRRGEIDLIGWDGEVLCFIEVKTRTTRDVKPAEAAVDRPKQKELIATAREYLRRLQTTPPYRFDVLSIYAEEEANSPEFNLLKSAFSGVS